MRKKLCSLIFISFFVTLNLAYSQVGINTEDPNSFTELDVTNLVSGDTIPKGIMIPRMSQSMRDRIDVSDASTVNSLLIYNTTEDCFNFFSKLENSWQSLCGKKNKSVAELADCSSILVSGDYKQGVSFNSTNSIKMSVDVIKSGAYTITAVPQIDNGYYFSTSGEFLSTGTFDLLLQGTGTPKEHTSSKSSGDNIVFKVNGIESSCTSTVIPIQSSAIQPLYTMTCASVLVSGLATVNKELNPLVNKISVQINGDPTAIDGYYDIKTDTIDGISFSASGKITGGLQTISLGGKGVPTSSGMKTFTIRTNSESSTATCTANVMVGFSSKKVLAIGTFGTNSYGYFFGGSGTNSNKLLTTKSNFGTLPNSKVYVEGVTFMHTGSGWAPTDSQLKSDLDAMPDVVILGVYWEPTANQCNMMVDYLKKGGVVLAFMEFGGTLQFLQSVFDTSVGGGKVNVAGAVYRYANIDDEILNGPFGDIRNLQWGEDASTTFAVTGIPAGAVTQYSSDANISSGGTGSGRITAFRHNTLNLIFVGDGGFNSGSNMDAISKTTCPFNIDTNNSPIPKNPGSGSTQGYGNSTNRFPVYNSVFTANAIAWAFKQAQLRP